MIPRIVALGLSVVALLAATVNLFSAFPLDAGAATALVQCVIDVPPKPLTAVGLATPWRLRAPCHEADPNMSAFVEATILDLTTGALSTYKPLVIDAGVIPVVPPTLPVLPAHAIVGIAVGFNGDVLTLADVHGSIAQGNCVNGEPGSVFGQVAFCNTTAFYAAANRAVESGLVNIPPRGTAVDGQPCPTTRTYLTVDQDPVDNTTSVQRITASGQVIQNTSLSRALFPTSKTLGNPGDFRLNDVFLDPALGCKPWMIRDLTDPSPTAVATSQHTDELRAKFMVSGPMDAGLTPAGDPMTLVKNKPDRDKLNMMRANVDQPAADDNFKGTTKTFCQGMLSLGLPRIAQNRAHFLPAAAPNATATNLYAFLGARFSASWAILGCSDLLGLQNPVMVITNGAGQAVDAALNLHPDPLDNNNNNNNDERKRNERENLAHYHR